MASNYTKNKHDIGILRQNGTDKIGMMLVQEKGTPIYQVFDDEYLARQYFTGVAGYGNLPPEKEIAIRQDDWRAGFGLETYDASDSKRYFSSYNMDLRFRGMGICSQDATAATMPTHTASSWNYANNFSDPSDDWADETLAYDGDTGTESTCTDASGAGSWSDYLILHIPAISCSKIRYWWEEVGASDVNDLEIDVYYDDSWNTVVSDDSQGEGSFAEAALGATKTVTKARVRVDQDAANKFRLYELQFYAESATITGVVRCFAEFNNHLYAGRDNTLIKVDKTTGTITNIKSFSVNITDLASFPDDKLYIALGTSNAYWEMTTAEAFTENTLANNYMELFAVVHSAAPTMWAKDGTNTIRSTTTPEDGGAVAWTGQTTVGSSSHAITSLITNGESLYMIKGDRPMYLDSSGNVQALTQRTQSIASTTGGTNSYFWDDALYMPYGDASLLEYDEDGDLAWRDPALYCTNLGDFDGAIQAIAGDEQFLFAIVDNSTKIEVLAGRQETIDSTTSWVWHPISEITLTGCQTAYVSSVKQKRLWIASNTSTESVYYIPLFANYGDVTNDTNKSFKSDGHFITPWLHANFKGDSKANIKLTLMMEDTSSTVYFEAHYQLKGSTNWTDIGDFKTSPTTSHYIPVDDVSSAKPVSTMIRFMFVAKTGSSSSTPKLLGYDCRAILYASQREVIYCAVRCAQGVTLKNALSESIEKTVRETLDESRTATWPVTIYDINGDTKTVKFLPLPSGMPRWSVIKDEKSRVIERHYNLLLQSVTLS